MSLHQNQLMHIMDACGVAQIFIAYFIITVLFYFIILSLVTFYNWLGQNFIFILYPLKYTAYKLI